MRENLERLLTRAVSEAASLEDDLRALFEASRDSNADDEHDPEGATVGFERAQLTATLAAAHHRIADLRDALARHEAGTYGTCETCGRPIHPDRLEARPGARTCITCAAKRR
ncbi:TraR/DksA C4-type zinc finger protein [Winogradskya consettensis]|uniref:DnaK suppressor protein n=1 Tax=Winogradskya consettensis TaxID=113560 RepID=A0A919SE34_9ACTN|nr:TraR/DksA C4-type zinc finger protein [Actinoplanes consettensis]GIM70039.1 DnaK suppressor protein [Actinoplanes consettensis]